MSHLWPGCDIMVKSKVLVTFPRLCQKQKHTFVPVILMGAGSISPKNREIFRIMATTGDSPNRYEIDEKNAIIALQAILTARGVVAEEKYERFAHYLGRLPPYRAILVYGQAINAIANRLEENNPYREALKTLGQQISESISPDFPQQVEQNPALLEQHQVSLADNLNKISTLMSHVQDKIAS